LLNIFASGQKLAQIQAKELQSGWAAIYDIIEQIPKGILLKITIIKAYKHPYQK